MHLQSKLFARRENELLLRANILQALLKCCTNKIVICTWNKVLARVNKRHSALYVQISRFHVKKGTQLHVQTQLMRVKCANESLARENRLLAGQRGHVRCMSKRVICT